LGRGLGPPIPSVKDAVKVRLKIFFLIIIPPLTNQSLTGRFELPPLIVTCVSNVSKLSVTVTASPPQCAYSIIIFYNKTT